MKGIVWIGVLVLAACSSGRDAKSPDEEGGGDDTEAAEEGEKGPETDYERTLRQAKERRAECDTLADAVQKAEKPGQHIVNLNDVGKLDQLAKDIDAGVKGVEDLKVTNQELESLRTRYVTAAKDMAKALHETADAKSSEQKKAKLARYRDLDVRTDQVIEEINHTCSQEQSEPPQEDAAK